MEICILLYVGVIFVSQILYVYILYLLYPFFMFLFPVFFPLIMYRKHMILSYSNAMILHSAEQRRNWKNSGSGSKTADAHRQSDWKGLLYSEEYLPVQALHKYAYGGLFSCRDPEPEERPFRSFTPPLSLFPGCIRQHNRPAVQTASWQSPHSPPHSGLRGRCARFRPAR